MSEENEQPQAPDLDPEDFDTESAFMWAQNGPKEATMPLNPDREAPKVAVPVQTAKGMAPAEFEPDEDVEEVDILVDENGVHVDGELVDNWETLEERAEQLQREQRKAQREKAQAVAEKLENYVDTLSRLANGEPVLIPDYELLREMKDFFQQRLEEVREQL